MAMDFYHVDEETPLMILPTSPRSDNDGLVSPTIYSSVSTSSQPSRSFSSGGVSARSNQTEFQLSVDKVSFIYSPKSSHQSYSTFQSPTSVCHDDELSILDPYFDVTKSRLRTAFDDALPDGETSCNLLLCCCWIHWSHSVMCTYISKRTTASRTMASAWR